MCFFFNDTATTEIYTLSLHDALPILLLCGAAVALAYRTYPSSATPGSLLAELSRAKIPRQALARLSIDLEYRDRKSTRLNSSHANISYAVFCLKKKKNNQSNISMSTI